MKSTYASKCLPILCPLAIAVVALSTAVGCNTDGSMTAPRANPAPAPGPTQAASDLVYPDGWDTIVIAAKYANEKAYSNAHWWIDRTDCGDEQYGPFEIDTWNALASAMNAAIKLTPLPTASEACTDAPVDCEMDGTAGAVLLDGSTRPLFEAKDWQICTTIPDPTVAAEALRWINDVVVMTNKAGCPQPTPTAPAPNPGTF